MTRNLQKIEAYLQIIERQGTLEGRFANVRRSSPTGGGGTFSLVCYATDLQTQKEVALKFFNPDSYTPQNTYRWDCFERESKLLAQLQGSKDIIRLVSGQAEFLYIPDPLVPQLSFPFAYYVMERADGNLEDIIAANAWSPRQILLALRCITRAVQRIHAKQHTHRDLKPANCLIVGPDVRVSDFGTARSVADNALVPVYSGPPGDRRYVSPEMMACLHDVDPRFAFPGDFFALGAILFEMFTGLNLGVRLFSPKLLTDLTVSMAAIGRNDRVKIFHQVIGSIAARYPLPLLDSLNPALPPCIRPRLNQLFRELCAIDYRQRISSFSQIFRGLDTCLLILDNEEKYLAWLREKQKRRAIRMSKRNGVSQ